MFKTIYSKYLLSFIVLLGLGFSSIAIIVSAVVLSYSMDTKSDLMDKTASMIYAEICNEMAEYNCGFVSAVERNSEKYEEVFGGLSDYCESDIILVDAEGKVLYHNGNIDLLNFSNLSAKTMQTIKDSPKLSKMSDFDGLFNTNHLNFVYPVEERVSGDNTPVGFIILTSDGYGMSQVFEKIIKIIIIASLWVFFAAIIIVYFITNRITTPIKQISKAVKEYSRGNFDIRIPVKGEDEIGALADAFNNMAKELDKMEKTRNTFFSSVSHDLKTPMTSIQGFLEGIIDGTIPKDKHEYYIGLVIEEVKRLTRLVNSILDISRMKSGSVKLAPVSFDICEMARLILISFEEKIEEKKLNIEFNCENDPSNVFADKDAVHQVLYNIVSNAMKFVYDEGTLKIDIGFDKASDKYNVSVYNTGIGIKEDELPFVFDSFYKADSSRGLDKTGTGLGLFIAKSKIEAHGEKIGVESEYEKYCRFYFTLSANEKYVQKMLSGN